MTGDGVIQRSSSRSKSRSCRPPSGHFRRRQYGATRYAGCHATGAWCGPADHADAAQVGELELNGGDHYRLNSIAARQTTREKSAEAYRLWYRIALPDSDRAWVQAARASTNDVDSAGRPSSVVLDFLPAVITSP